MYPWSKYEDSSPCCFVETDKATGEYFCNVQSTMTNSPLPDLHCCIKQIFLRCIYGQVADSSPDGYLQTEQNATNEYFANAHKAPCTLIRRYTQRYCIISYLLRKVGLKSKIEMPSTRRQVNEASPSQKKEMSRKGMPQVYQRSRNDR